MKSCKKGYYYCFTDKKCKKIPKGWHLMSSGYIMRDKDHEDKEEEKKKNGNGHHSNGNGDGSGESNGGSNGGGDGGSGVAEGWSAKYKKSIDCNNPKGFSQRAHCQGRKKMNEAKNGDHEVAMAQSQLAKAEKNIAKLRKALGKKEKDIPAWMQAKITDTAHDTDAAAGYVDKISEARDGKSAKDKGYSLRDWFKGGGWVQAGGKYDGKPCAKQPGQKTKPFCRDADDRASMSKDERERRAKKKRREDPNPNRKGKAKMVTQEEFVNEKKDACYHKVKSRYSVWPSAYASGALVKCRKSGAKNWGNKTKKEGFSDWREDMLLEGLEDKLRKMSPEQIEDLIKANKGAEQKIRDAIKNMGTPKSQGPGAQLPNIPKQPASTSSATPRETYQRGGSDRVSYQRGGGSETYQRGGSDRVPYQRKPRPTKSPAPKPKVGAVRKVLKTLSKVKNPKVAAVLGLGALGAGMIYKMKKQQNEGYEFSNWRDDFKAMEFEFVDIIKTEPMKGLSEAKSTKDKLKEVSKQLAGASKMHAKQSKEVAKCVDELDEAKKCWPGYEKKGTKKMFGKTYNNCVKKEEFESVSEAKLGKCENNKIEKYVKGMKKNKGSFKDNYGSDSKSVMYATATNMAKKACKEEMSDWRTELVEAKINKSKMKCNKPKAQAVGDSLTGKSHVVKACEGGKEKIIRFGQRGVKGSPKKKGESKEYASRRHRFQTRHAKNIAKGKMSAAYWANKVKW
jgi:hypothetical protein